ncbi:MAG: MBOAT family protein [Verrucomicrobiae bacterium]|nr:MBOAT family protein [Verrucomicrobiae bacterium]
MLFNSYEFIFVFLPVTLAGFFWLGHHGRARWAIGWLVLASFFFYGWWNPKYLALLGGSVLFNYSMGLALSRRVRTGAGRALMIAGVAANLLLLGVFKYTNFLVDNFNALCGTDWQVARIIIPLGISFFTFQQIAYLVDAWRGETREYNFVDYALFVTFFPQLIAGPIVHHKEMLPQFSQRGVFRFSPRDFAIGVSIFAVGLFKKAVIADGVAGYSTPVFDLAKNGGTPGFAQAWGAVLAYTLQIYFDFSGYSDMAIGLGRLFGIVLPLNFHSPYRAANIIEFWRRWHMTLSRFLRDYLYFTLGGNRRGPARRYLNLMLTMLLGGLWHGAGWTFVIWGGLHGVYLMINHGWRALRRRWGHDLERSSLAGRALSGAVTFLAVVVAWVFFRAETLPAALAMLGAMTDLSALGEVTPAGLSAAARQIAVTGALLCVVWFFPNTQQIMARVGPALNFPESATGTAAVARWWQWRPTAGWALAAAAVFLIAVLHLNKVTEFLYFQF